MSSLFRQLGSRGTGICAGSPVYRHCSIASCIGRHKKPARAASADGWWFEDHAAEIAAARADPTKCGANFGPLQPPPSCGFFNKSNPLPTGPQPKQRMMEKGLTYFQARTLQTCSR